MFVFLGEFGVLIDGIRNYVGLVIFGLFVPQFDFQECQKVVHLLVKLVKSCMLSMSGSKLGFM